MTCYICTVCNKRWGPAFEGADVELTRCEKHKNKLTTAEIYAKGMTVGMYESRARLREIKNKKN